MSTPTVTPSTPMPPAKAALTPALVRQVAERVYALWLADLKFERERLRLVGHTRPGQRGQR